MTLHITWVGILAFIGAGISIWVILRLLMFVVFVWRWGK